MFVFDCNPNLHQPLKIYRLDTKKFLYCKWDNFVIRAPEIKIFDRFNTYAMPFDKEHIILMSTSMYEKPILINAFDPKFPAKKESLMLSN